MISLLYLSCVLRTCWALGSYSMLSLPVGIPHASSSMQTVHALQEPWQFASEKDASEKFR